MKKTNIHFILFFIFTFFALQSKSDFSIFNLFNTSGGVKPVDNQLYNEECGSCHFAYQPGLLPRRSWNKLMDNQSLKEHFGEDISYEDKEILTKITTYLESNAADISNYRRSVKINNSIDLKNTPIRISSIPYIKRKHHELPLKIIKQEMVGYLGNCTACHNSAKSGNYDEHTVTVPNITAGFINDELNAKPDGYEGVISQIGKNYKILSTKVKESSNSKKLCRVVSLESTDKYLVKTFCKFKGGNWF